MKEHAAGASVAISTNLDAYARKWEQAVHRQEAKGIAKLKAEIRDDTSQLHALVARGIRRVCMIGKKLEAVKRLAGHGAAIDAWADLGYSQPQAAKYIQASKYEPMLVELQKRRDDPIGIAQAYAAAIAAKRFHEVGFADLQSPELLADAVEESIAKPKRSRGVRDMERLRGEAERLIGKLETRGHEPAAHEIVALLHQWTERWLSENPDEVSESVQ